MSRSSKQQQKIDALQVLGILPDKDVKALAKKSRLVRVKAKRVLLRGTGRRVIGLLTLVGDSVEFMIPPGYEIDFQDKGNTVKITLPSKAEKPKENKAKAEKPIDTAPQGS